MYLQCHRHLYPTQLKLKTTFQYKVTEIKDNVAEMCYIIDKGHRRILLFDVIISSTAT